MTFEPTHADDKMCTPTCCYACGRHATGAGIGNPDRGGDPLYLCEECLMIAEQIRNAKRLDLYETKAVTEAGEAAGAYLDRLDRTDLAQLSADEWAEFCRTMIVSFGNSIRNQIMSQEVPF